MVRNTAAKGRRFEYAVKRVLLDSGYVVVRLAASKPWDLVAANQRVVYAVECKSSAITVQQAKNEFQELKKKVMRRVDGVETPTLFIPIVFFNDKLKRLSMFSSAVIVGSDRSWRPYFDGTKMMEVQVDGPGTEESDTEGSRTEQEKL